MNNELLFINLAAVRGVFQIPPHCQGLERLAAIKFKPLLLFIQIIFNDRQYFT